MLILGNETVKIGIAFPRKKTLQVDGDSGQSYTYGQLGSLTKKLASGLTKKGFKKGDVLAIYATNCPAFAVVAFGVMRCGGTITTINPQYTAEEVQLQLKVAGATWLMTVGSLLHRVKDATRQVGIASDHIVVRGDDSLGCLSLSTLLEDDGSSFPKVDFNPKEDVAFLPFSSGTTGLSKGVMLTHYNLVAQGCIVCSPGFLDFNHDSVVLAFLPFFHVYGLVIVLSLALHRGSRVVTMSKFEPEKFLQLLQEHKVGTAGGSDETWDVMLHIYFTGRVHCSHLEGPKHSVSGIQGSEFKSVIIKT